MYMANSKFIILAERIVRFGVNFAVVRAQVFRCIEIMHIANVGRPFRPEEFRLDPTGNVDLAPWTPPPKSTLEEDHMLTNASPRTVSNRSSVRHILGWQVRCCFE